MDFHSLARKELQALCKKNKIPANITNVAMANALKALEMVEGLDELMNAARSDPSESEPRTACRTSTRRKPIIVEPESSQPLTRTRCATRRAVGEEGEQENKHVNLPETPAIPASRRRAPATLARQKIDMESEAPKSPAREAPVVSTKKKNEALKSYGTRQSVRLLEKTMADLSLIEKRRVEVVKIEGLGDEAEEIERKEDVLLGRESEVVSSQDMNESVEDNKSYGHEVDDSEVISDQKLVQSQENESIIKDEVEEDNKSNEHEVDEDSGVSVQRSDKSMDDESEVKVELPEESKNVDSQAVSDVISENCIKLDNPLGVDGEDETTSGKVTGMNPDSTDEKGPVAVITAQTDTVDASVEPQIQDPLTSIEQEIEKETDEIQEPSTSIEQEIEKETDEIQEPSTSIEPEIEKEVDEIQEPLTSIEPEIEKEVDEIQEPLTSIETSQLVQERSEMDSTEEDGGDDDMLSESDTEEGSDVGEPEEVSSSDEESLSDGTELDETSDDSETDEVPDGSLTEDVGENEIAEETQEAPLLPEADYEESQMRDEKCAASDHLVNNGSVSDPENAVAANEKTPLKQQQVSPFNKITAPFSANTIQGQFPRPTESTPRKSSTKKKLASNQKTIHPDIINKENINTSNKKAEQKMKKKQKVAIEDPEKMSLRQIRKALKSLAISKGEGRAALQKLADNNCAEEAGDGK